MELDKNEVLLDSFRQSENFYKSDLIFQHYFANNFSSSAKNYIDSKLNNIGEKAALVMDKLSLLADKNTPQIIKRDFLGRTINQIAFHPSYQEMLKIAVEGEMFYTKWAPEMQKKYLGELNHLSFSISYFYAMSECGLFCPLCMTDGVATLIDKFCTEEDKNRLLPKIYTKNTEEVFTGAMFLTEKRGGSDVGANIASATPIKGNEAYYHLNGEKWFCSNANAEIIFALARTNPTIKGTKGLSIFLIEKHKQPNPEALDFIRLKDKLGVKSMASAEVELNNAVGKLIGEEFKGFKIMSEMINVSRVYNSIAALSTSRRALIEAFQFLTHRKTFGKMAIEHPLVRLKLEELGALNVANFYLNWRVIEALDAEENNKKEKEMLRLLTPMLKKASADLGVYITREAMELMGGLGYIEDTVMPKLMRDVMVLPIWEGASNIMVLDMIRASLKTNGIGIMFQHIKQQAEQSSLYGEVILSKLNTLNKLFNSLKNNNQEVIEASSKNLFEELTLLFQMSLLIRARDKKSKDWIDPSLNYFSKKIKGELGGIQNALTKEEVINLIAWK